jgi:hypothetical protein
MNASLVLIILFTTKKLCFKATTVLCNCVDEIYPAVPRPFRLLVICKSKKLVLTSPFRFAVLTIFSRFGVLIRPTIFAIVAVNVTVPVPICGLRLMPFPAINCETPADAPAPVANAPLNISFPLLAYNRLGRPAPTLGGIFISMNVMEDACTFPVLNVAALKLERKPRLPRPTRLLVICVSKKLVLTSLVRFAVLIRPVRFAVLIRSVRFAVLMSPLRSALLTSPVRFAVLMSPVRFAVLISPLRFAVLMSPVRFAVLISPVRLGVLIRSVRFAVLTTESHTIVDKYPAVPNPITVEVRSPLLTSPVMDAPFT